MLRAYLLSQILSPSRHRRSPFLELLFCLIKEQYSVTYKTMLQECTWVNKTLKYNKPWQVTVSILNCKEQKKNDDC